MSNLTELKPILYKEIAVEKIGLFDSYSHNSNTERSDMDILIELERSIGLKFFTLEIFLEHVFNEKIDLVTKNTLKEQIKDQIFKQVNFV